MTKDDTIALLAGVRAAAIYGFILGREPPADLAKQCRERGLRVQDVDGEVFVDLTLLAKILESDEERKRLEGNFFLFLEHTLIRMSHEVIAMYCDKTSQFNTYKGDPLFWFVNVVRNILSHHDGSTLGEFPKKLVKQGTTEVTWRHRTIRKSDEGKLVKLTMKDVLMLQDDLREFVQQKLT